MVSSHIYALSVENKLNGNFIAVMPTLGEVLGLSILSLLKAVMYPTVFISNMNSYQTGLEWVQD